jgi:glycosyltransferase involved in cell wall biosynthesis
VHVLLVNWQDRENPQAGGAELHLHEIFGRIAGMGHTVTLLCGGWPGAPARAELDGISVYRVGTRYTFPLLARRWWSRHGQALGADLLVEDINKVPLFTPRWGAPRVMALVPHLFGTTVFQEASAPLAAAVWLAERPLGSAYGNVPFEAISESTANDLAARGIPRERITVIYPGIDTAQFTPAPELRDSAPLFVYLGRLKRYKGVDVVLRAFAALRHPTARLLIAGSGDYRPALERLAKSLDLGDRARFLGFVPESEKLTLLRRAWALLFASPKEGWGITNLEAAACGTPVIASDSPGLRESVRHGETGFLVPHGDLTAMMTRMRELAESPTRVASFAASARAFAERFSWDAAARQTELHLRAIVGEAPGGAARHA